MGKENRSAAGARYFDFYDLSPVGYISLNEQGLILAANLTAAAMMGTPRDELINQALSRFILPEDLKIYSLHAEQFVATGIPQLLALDAIREDLWEWDIHTNQEFFAPRW